ncbi:MAG: hypothetical protein HOW73_08870 [Polyangiaceae bacterium]|nr:hypothetical protein [Polyangiaceae bacterium]
MAFVSSASRWRTSLLFACALGVASTSTIVTPAEAGPRKPVRVAQAGPAPKRSSVSSVIQKGRDMYDDARYEESIQTLSGVVVRSDATKEERIEAYKLLAFNNIALGKNEEADAFARALFVLEETFELPKTESPRFRDFFDKAKKQWEADGKPGKAKEGEGAPEKTAVAVKHTPAAQIESGTALKIEGKIDDPDVVVEKVQLYYRSGAKGKFAQKSLAYSMGAFRGEIPAASVTPPLLEYYVLALDKAGLPLAGRGDADTPLRVVVPEESTSVVESPWFWIPIGAVVVTGVVLGAVLGTQLGSESTVRINVTE